ncbi:MAG: hypothetical protein ACO1NU_13335 [Arcticibacter sp.]
MAQSLLDRQVSVHVIRQPIASVLTDIGLKGGFYFSYNGRTVQKDSLVSFTSSGQTVYRTLIRLLGEGYEFEERNSYIIIRPALRRMSFINTDINSESNSYSISGIIVDERTGERLVNTSVYETEQLVSTLTDEHGYFKLKLKSANLAQVRLTASKVLYRDTSLNFLKTVEISRRTRAGNLYDSEKDVGNKEVGRFFTTAAQRLQSMNIQNFFASRPYQISLTPGVSSHGALSSQVVNKFSLNMVGGYTAGVDGLEIGGLFNINKRDTRYLQLAGIFNLVGGRVTGIQLAGVSNQALDTVKGVQVSGFINKADSQVSGLQVAALNNKAQVLKGVQIGLVNVVDRSEGTSIGLINIIRNGFYRLTLSTNDLTNTNVSLKTGTHGFYSTLLFGANISGNNKMYSLGMGVGHDEMITDQVYLSAEAAYQFSFTGLWDDRWAQAKLLLNWPLTESLYLVAGPTYNKYSYTGSQPGYQRKFVKSLHYNGNSNPVKRWVGWEAGISTTSVFSPKRDVKKARRSSDLFVGVAATAGFGWHGPSTLVTGGEILFQKDFGGSMSGTLSGGYVYHDADGGFVSINTIQMTEFRVRGYKAIPFKAGIRTYTGKRFFFSGELGAAVGLNQSGILTVTDMVSTEVTVRKEDRAHSSILYAVSGGYSFDNGLEAGIKFEDYARFNYIKQFNIRLAYRFKL